jgi:hypothetical protein
MKTVFVVLLVSTAILFAPTPTCASITITNSYLNASVQEPPSGYALNSFNGTNIPNNTPLNAVYGQDSSKNIIDWSVAGDRTTLAFDAVHQRTGTVYTYTYGYPYYFTSTVSAYADTDGFLQFTASVDANYSAYGFYNSTDVGGGDSGNVHEYAWLFDYTANSYLFISEQQSQSTHNEQLVLGGTGGDYDNYFAGSLDGALVAGHQYVLYLSLFTSA